LGTVSNACEGIIGLWNGGCERISSFTAAEATNQTLDIIIPENLRERHRAHAVRSWRSSGRSHVAEGIDIVGNGKNGKMAALQECKDGYGVLNIPVNLLV
jgi:hypothetical protein